MVNTKTNRPIHPQPTSSKTYNPYAVLVPFTSVFLLGLTVNTCRKKERPPTTLVAILNLRARSRGYASTNQTFFASEGMSSVVFFFGVSEFESSRGRGENFFFFFWPRLISSQRGIGKKRSFSSNLIALLVVATRIERRYWFFFRRGGKIPGRNSVGEFFCL